MRLDSRRIPFFAAFLVAGLTTAYAIRYGTFVAWGTDAAGYAGSARRWATGELFGPAPIQLWGSFPNRGLIEMPLSYRFGPITGTDVNAYPLGFPVFLAPADLIDRELGVYVAASAFAGLLIWSTFLVGRRLAGLWAGVLAALLIGVSPVTFAHAITPMSDVAATGFVILALEMSLRRSGMSAVAAGAAVAAAVMIRPVVAPLAVIPGVMALATGASGPHPWRAWQWRRAFLFTLCAAIGPIMLAWSQKVLYGGYLTSGYLGAATFFKADNVARNLAEYPELLMDQHTPLVFFGVLGAITLSNWPPRAGAPQLALALLALAVLNYATLISFDIADLRFVLPAITAIFILLAGATGQFARLIARRSRAAAAVSLLPALVVANEGRPTLARLTTQADLQAHVRLMGRYCREVLPANAAVITLFQSGAVAHYTGRQVIRFDWIEPEALDAALDVLVRRGYRPVFLIDRDLEGPLFSSRFPRSRYHRLAWQPRAEFVAGTTMSYLDFADRDGNPGSGWPIDVLR